MVMSVTATKQVYLLKCIPPTTLEEVVKGLKALENGEFVFNIKLEDKAGKHWGEGTLFCNVTDGQIYWSGDLSVTIEYDPR